MRFVLTVLVALVMGGTQPDQPPSRRLWTVPDEASFCGPLATDARRIPYGSTNDGEIYVYDTVSAQKTRLTQSANPGGPGGEPSESFGAGCWAVSPDGNHLAYSWRNGSRESLRIISLTTGSAQPRELFADANVTGVEPTGWSPDGAWIGFSVSFADRPFSQTRIVSVKDGTTQVLKTTSRPDENVGDVYFSPDGRFLLYEHFVNNWSEQSVTIVERARFQDVASIKLGGQTMGLLGWIDAGVAYFQRTATAAALFAVPIEDGKAGQPRQLTPNLGNVEPQGVSATGALVYRRWTSSTWQSTIAGIDFASGRVLAPAATVASPVADASLFPASWSRDGRRLAIVAIGQDGRRTLLVRSAETGTTTAVQPDLTAFQGADLAPDGRAMATVGTDNARHRGLFLIDAQTGVSTMVAEGAVLFRAWSRDGAKIYFDRPIDDGTGDIWIVEHGMATGTERNLHRASGTWSARMERAMSADGRTLFYLKSELAKGQRQSLVARDTASGRETILVTERRIGPLSVAPGGEFVVASIDDVLALIPTAGGNPMSVPRAGGLDPTILTWAPDGRSFIARTMAGPDPKARVATTWWIPADGRPARKLDLPFGPTTSAVGSAGSQVAFVERIGPSNPPSELWMLPPAPATGGRR
jgi:Tol biopolymer transport system component